MKRMIPFLALLFAFGFYQSVAAQCYLTVENSSELETKAITQISLVQISQHFETVNEIPPQGIGTDACVYTLSASVVSNGILVTVKGRNASTYGDSKLRGFDGFQHALFRAIISAKPEQKQPICERYYNLMGTDCSGVAAPTPPPAPAATDGNLVVRVPHDYRYAQILSNGLLIGEMNGEVVREFKVDTGVTLVIKGVDGIYQSEEVYTSVQPDAPTRIDLKEFKSTQAVQPPPTPQPEPTPPPARVEDDEPEFAEDGAFVFGFSFMPAYGFSGEDDARKKQGSEYNAVESATGFDWFVDIFFTTNIGIGVRSFYYGTVEDNQEYSGASKTIGVSGFLFTGSLWFPVSTKNKGYSHFGLTAGAGSSAYTLVYEDQNGKVAADYEVTGSASMFGAYFDWGGDVFGGRVGYTSISTDYRDLENKLTGETLSLSEAGIDADASGAGLYIAMRWGF